MLTTAGQALNSVAAPSVEPGRVRRRVVPLGALLLLFTLCLVSAAHAQRCGRCCDMHSVQLEDPVEAALIEQELKIRPVKVAGPRLYYCADGGFNAALRKYGYDPVRRNPDEVLSRLVLTDPPKDSREASRVGLTVLIREPRYWIVRVNSKQSESLKRRGYTLRSLGLVALHPRQIRITTRDMRDVQRASELDVDIYSVRPTQRVYVVEGAAFDHVIDRLRAAGMTVEVRPDPLGVSR